MTFAFYLEADLLFLLVIVWFFAFSCLLHSWKMHWIELQHSKLLWLLMPANRIFELHCQGTNEEWSFLCVFWLERHKQLNILYTLLVFFRSVLAVLGLAPDSQSTSQAQSSQAHTGDTSNSEKDAVAEKSKESSSASWSYRNLWLKVTWHAQFLQVGWECGRPMGKGSLLLFL